MIVTLRLYLYKGSKFVVLVIKIETFFKSLYHFISSDNSITNLFRLWADTSETLVMVSFSYEIKRIRFACMASSYSWGILRYIPRARTTTIPHFP